MPEGYYSGDKPNPNLRAFVEQRIKKRLQLPRDKGNKIIRLPTAKAGARQKTLTLLACAPPGG